MHLHLDARCLVGIGIQFQEPLQHSNARCRIVCSLGRGGVSGGLSPPEHLLSASAHGGGRARVTPSVAPRTVTSLGSPQKQARKQGSDFCPVRKNRGPRVLVFDV